MKECKYCDLEGPHYLPGPFFTAIEHLDLHRALHRLGRELMKPFERLLDKLTRSGK